MRMRTSCRSSEEGILSPKLCEIYVLFLTKCRKNPISSNRQKKSISFCIISKAITVCWMVCSIFSFSPCVQQASQAMDRRVTSKLLPRFPRETACAPGSLSRWSKKTKTSERCTFYQNEIIHDLDAILRVHHFNVQGNKLQMSSPLLKERFQIAKRSAFILSSLTFFRDILAAYSWMRATTACDCSLQHTFRAPAGSFQRSTKDFCLTEIQTWWFNLGVVNIIHHPSSTKSISLSTIQSSKQNTNKSIDSIDMTSFSSTTQPTHLPCCWCAAPQVLLTKALQLWVSALHASALPVQSSASWIYCKH